MATVPGGPAPTKQRGSLGFGAAAVTLGFIGLGFSFLAPFGLFLSSEALICGVIGWLLAPPGRSSGFWWSLWGTLLSLIAVALNAALLAYGTFKNWLLGG